MSSSLIKVLSVIRSKAKNDNELGQYFEKLTKIFLENDDIQIEQYSKIWHYSDWAKEHSNYSVNDIGIDLVAKLRNAEGYCAIQCKCYQSNRSINKADLDSFISASSTSDFKRLMLVDTSSLPLSKNAQSVFDNLETEYIRIQKSQLEGSRIEWSSFLQEGKISLRKKKTPLDHQIKALNAVEKGFSEGDRGKLIMACGTGKTYTSLCIAEKIAGEGKNVLYMVPSLSLMSQTIREWKNDSQILFNAYSACSDAKVGKRKSSEDLIEFDLNQLAFPATTDPKKLSEQIFKITNSRMTVIFSTYQSIDVISKAQNEYKLKEFDLIICDEAHRTTGVTFSGEEDSQFVRIHDNNYIKGKKRLYMTATPRIYGDKAQKKEEEGEITLYPMDREDIFGKNFFYRGFGWAVENNLLSDYKVIVLNINEQQVSDLIQRQFTEGSELNLDDATKMIGCYKALAKIGITTQQSEEDIEDQVPMKTALAFCQSIKRSQLFSEQFSDVVEEYKSNERILNQNKSDLDVEIHHVDGKFNSEERTLELQWLEEDTDNNKCRILSNARCLSEGVDVPALDAVMFLHPRKSQIDIVQSVGRVMRKAEGKKIGYVILPIAVAPGISATKALQDNERYKVVWQILNALRTHDERLDSTINRIALGEDVSDKIEIIDGTAGSELDSTTSKVDDVRKRSKKKTKTQTGNKSNDQNKNDSENTSTQLSFSITELNQAIKAKIVEKCGTREYWEKWAEDIAKIAQTHITRIKSIVFNKGTPQNIAFNDFLEEIRDDLNPQISESDAVEMLAQHIVTRPVFDNLFQGNKFTSENLISKSIEKILNSIYDFDFKSESRSLEKFYSSVERRAKGIITVGGRQKLIFELYDRFFRNAFPTLTQKLGIVYTPVEVVDFIINSIEDILNTDFNKSISDKGVQILDPFTGTGTFITRLLQSGIIKKENLKYKYTEDIHANEIILLACYIAGINIEAVYSEEISNNKYESFNGLVLTDTFQLFEQEKDMIANLLPDNSRRRTNQKKKNITVIMGNPPYSSGQSSANDNAANIKYRNLDKRIEETYSALSKVTNKNSLYDSYIRAFRWASDRVDNEGVIAFISNAGWIEGNATAGFRNSIEKEFSKIYIFHLRGNQRTSGDRSKREGGKIFGSGSRAAIAITILIKNAKNNKKGDIYFYDIGDYLDRDQKLNILSNFKSIKSLKEKKLFKLVKPNEDNDWLNQGDKSYRDHISIGNKKDKNEPSIFKNYTNGLKTNRDSWCYNSSKIKLENQIKQSFDFYNKNLHLDSHPIDNKRISWSRAIIEDFNKNKIKRFSEKSIYNALYRPFDSTNFVYCDRSYNECVYQLPKIFPSPKHKNLLIIVSGLGSNKEFSCLMTDKLPDVQVLSNCQCFPLYLYRDTSNDENSFLNNLIQSSKESGISKECKKYFISQYKKNEVTNEDIFYYVYAILHSNQYRSKYKNNLSKELPRIPICKEWSIFTIYSKVGRELSDLHINYMNADKYPISFKEGDLRLLYIKNRNEFFKVKAIKFLNKDDKTTVKYNENLTIEGIPPEAYNYQINGKSAIEWVMERYSIKIDKKTSIKNDINDYIDETNQKSEYILEIFQKIITISLKTNQLVNSLPEFKFESKEL